MNEGNGAEVTLERTLIAELPENTELLGWGNMTPVASGVHEPGSDRRMAVDLVEVSDSIVTLIELKIRSNTPLFAAIEVLGYGFCYMLARAFPARFGCQPNLNLFHEKKTLQLRVLAPQVYYGDQSRLTWLANLERRINQDLNSLDLPFRHDDCPYTVDFGFEAFRPEFNWNPLLFQEDEHRNQAREAFLHRHSPWL